MNAINRQLRSRRRDASGQVLVLFALMLVVLLLASALAVDYGGWLVAKRNQQNVSDAAALAGAQQLTRPLTATCVGGTSKAVCARQAAWQVIKSQLNLSSLNATTQGTTSTTQGNPYVENGWKMWVASPPSDAGSDYLGHTSGPGNVYVRIEHAGQTYLSSIAGITRTVTAWSTAGRFPANFAVIGMCSPTSITSNCLAGDANIKLDGTTTNLIVSTGDLGTNRWTKSGGTSSAVALGPDSNAYMQLFDSCWNAGGNQCNLFGYSGGSINTSDIRSAIPLGAPVQDPTYAAPTISATTAPNQCRLSGGVSLASTQILEQRMPDVQLAAAVQPRPQEPLVYGAGFVISGKVTAAPGGAGLGGINIQILNSSNTVVATDTTKTTPAASVGQYSVNNIPAGTYTVRAYDSTDFYFPTTAPVTVGPDGVVNLSMPTSPVVSGTVTSTAGGGGLSGVTVTITAGGQNYTTTTNASGFYTRSVPQAGAFIIDGAKTGYTSNGPISGGPMVPPGTYANNNFTMTPAPGSVTGTITDAVTGLVVPGVTVTLSSGESSTTNTSGVYNIASTTQGTKTITLSGAAIDATSGYAYSIPASGGSINITGPMTQNFTVWPKGCYDGGSNTNNGNWQCNYPSGSNCPAPTNPSAANVNCPLTQANAIRPGTYKNITIANGTCAWLDAKGGATGLASGQSGGIYHIKGTISIGNDAYLFGDGVTLVFDQGSNIDVGNGGGFVLNYGTHNTSGNATCDTTTDFSTAYNFGESGNFCFRTAGTIANNTTTATAQTEDRAYAAWTTKGNLLWSGTQSPTYSDDTVAKGSELGITFFFYCPSGSPQCGLGNNSRMKLSTASMGYLFNGVLYGPGDDIQLGGGKDGQTAAGQIVGWTIEYHGGTRIQQNWYGSPVDGQPFLIEPVLGE